VSLFLTFVLAICLIVFCPLMHFLLLLVTGQGVPRAKLFGQLDSGQSHFSLHPLSFYVFVCKFWLLAMGVQLGSCEDPIL